MKKAITIVAMVVAMAATAHTHRGIRVTAYMPVVAQCNSNPLLTADGSHIDLRRLKAGSIRWCAVSRDLLRYYPYGTRIHVEGHGWYEVHDTTNKRLRKTVDLLVHPSAKGCMETNKTIHN